MTTEQIIRESVAADDEAANARMLAEQHEIADKLEYNPVDVRYINGSIEGACELYDRPECSGRNRCTPCEFIRACPWLEGAAFFMDCRACKADKATPVDTAQAAKKWFHNMLKGIVDRLAAERARLAAVKLKPCPFCGSEAAIMEEPDMDNDIAYVIRCTGCGMTFNCYGEDKYLVRNIDELIDRWNTRKCPVNDIP